MQAVAAVAASAATARKSIHRNVLAKRLDESAERDNQARGLTSFLFFFYTLLLYSYICVCVTK